MMAWLKSVFSSHDPPSFDNTETLHALRETKSIADEVAAGNPVPQDRLRSLELRLTGNVVEDHLTGAAARVRRT